MEMKYGEGRPDSFSPANVNEGVLQTAMIIPTVCYQADMGVPIDIVCRLGEAVGVLGTVPNNLEAVSLQYSTSNGASWFSDGTGAEGDVTNAALFASSEAGYGYFMATSPEDWGPNLQQAYYALGLIKSDGTNADTGLLTASASPYDTGPLAVYSPTSWMTVLAMMKSNPSKYGEVMNYRSSKSKSDMLRWIGSMEMGRTIATIILAIHLLSQGKALRRLINVSDLSIPSEESLDVHDPNDYFAYMVRSNIDTADLFGLGNATFFSPPFFQTYLNSLVPEGGIPMCPLGLRVAQMFMSEMTIPADLQRLVDFCFLVGPKAAGTEVGEIDLNLTAQQVITTEATDSYALTPEVLSNILIEFDKQLRGCKTFRGLNLKVETINFTLNDMLDNRAGAREGTIMRTIFQNQIEFYVDTAVGYLRWYDAGTSVLSEDDIFHNSIDVGTYVLIEKCSFDADESHNRDIMYGLFFYEDMMQDLFEDGGASSAAEQDVLYIQDIHWQGYPTYSTYSVAVDEAGEYAWAFANMQLPAETARYFEQTLPHAAPTLSISSKLDIATKCYPNTTDCTFTTDDFTYDTQAGVFTYAALSKKYTNINEFIKWITEGGCFNFGSRKNVSPDTSDGVPDDIVDTKKEEVIVTPEG